jgi:quercetin dioxygenase-like cupin family protein
MKVTDYKEIGLRPVDIEGAEGVKMRWLISQKEAPNFAMRMFELDKGGHTPLHTHLSEHEVFILEGEGELVFENTTNPFKAGYVVYVPPDKLHQFRNTGNGLLRFLCLIPNK